MSSNTQQRKDKEPDLRLLTDSEDDSDSDEEDEKYRQALAEDWEEAMKAFRLMFAVVVFPLFGKWAGRRCAHWLYSRYVRLGLGRTFFLGGR